MSTASLPDLETTKSASDSSERWKIGLCGLLLALPAIPLLVLHCRILWQREHYQFFPLVPLGALALALPRLKGLGQLEPGNRALTFLLVAVIWLMFAGATVLLSPWLGAVTAVLLVAVAIYAFGGLKLLRRLLPAWLFLWLVIPPPFDLDKHLVTTLQERTARWSSRVLDQLDVHHVMQGNVVALPNKKLLVEEACSGINSLFAMFTCSVFFVLWNQRPIIRGGLLVASSLAWVLMANVVRVVCVTYAQTRWGVDLVEGWPHEVLGWTLFTVMLLMIWSTDRLLEFLNPLEWFRRRDHFKDKRAAASTASEAETRAPQWRTVPLFSTGILGCFVVLGLLEMGILWPRSSQEMAALEQRLHQLGEESLPAQVGQWKRVRFEVVKRERSSQLGEHSRMWTYASGSLAAVISVDYVFPGWHELCECYTSTGWQVTERTALTQKESSDTTYIQGLMQNAFDQQGCVLFSLIDDRDRCQAPPELAEDTTANRLASRLSNRVLELLTLFGHRGSVELTQALAPPTYQLQLYLETYRQLTEADRDSIRAFYLDMRDRVRNQLGNQK